MDQSINANRRATEFVVVPHDENHTNVMSSGLNGLVDSYNDLLFMSHNNMPAYIVHEGYEDILYHLSELTNIVNAQYSEHRHIATMISRQRRRQWRREHFRERVAANAQANARTNDGTNDAPVNEPIGIDYDETLRDTERRAPLNRRPLVRKISVLKQSDLNTTLPDVCSICMDSYTKINSVLTSCTHTFCKSCYDSFETSCLAKDEPSVCCPLCRTFNPRITEFRARKQRAPVSRNSPMEMDIPIV